MQGVKVLSRTCLLLLLLVTSQGVNLPPQWGIVSSTDVSEIKNISGGSWAHVPGTIINGTQLVPGTANPQPNWEACAASCGATSQCNAFNFCGNKPTCIADPLGQRLPFGACQLLYQEEAAQGRGVTQLAGGNAQLGDAGVKMLIERPTSIPEGYDMVYGESMIYHYDMPCPGSWNNGNGNGQCLLTEPLPDLISRCNSWEQCQMIVVGPLGWGSYKMLYGWLKGWANSSWAPIDLKKGNLNPTTYLLIKKGQWLGSFPDNAAQSGAGGGGGGGGGLSGGAVAGIVVAAAAAACAVAAGAFFVLRRRQRLADHQGGGGKDLEAGSPEGSGSVSGVGAHISAASKGLSVGSSQMDEVVAAFSGPGEGGGESGETEKLVARLLADAPSPQWADVIVPRHQVQFVLKDGRPVKLGTGCSGTVYRGQLNAASPCAIKVYDFQEDEKLARYFIQEAVVLRRLRHPNVIQFLGVSVTEGRGLLLMELMAGDLWKAMRADTGEGGARSYSWYKRGRQAALQIASGLMYLHSQHLVHLDLKPQNVLLARDGTARIGDVGFTRMLHKTHISDLEGRIGTFTWCAPEVLLGGRAGQPADIYSLGIIIWELCTGEQPVRGCMAPLRSPEQCPPEVARLHAACMQQDPAARPTAAEIVRVLNEAAGSAAASAVPAAAAQTAPAAALTAPAAGPPSQEGAASSAAELSSEGAATCPESGPQGACPDSGPSPSAPAQAAPALGQPMLRDPVSRGPSRLPVGEEATEVGGLSRMPARGVEVRHAQPMAKSPFAALG